MFRQTDTLRVVPALVPVAAGVWLAFQGGGYAVDGWGVAGVACLLAFVAAVVIGPGRTLSPWQVSAPVALVGARLPWPALDHLGGLAAGGAGRIRPHTRVRRRDGNRGDRRRRRAVAPVADAGGGRRLGVGRHRAGPADGARERPRHRCSGWVGWWDRSATAAGSRRSPPSAPGRWRRLRAIRATGLPLRAAAAAGAGATAAIVIPTEARAALVALVISGLVFIAVSPRGLASGVAGRGDRSRDRSEIGMPSTVPSRRPPRPRSTRPAGR